MKLNTTTVERLWQWIEWVRENATVAVFTPMHDLVDNMPEYWPEGGGQYEVFARDEKGNACEYFGWLEVPLVLDGLRALHGTSAVDIDVLRHVDPVCAVTFVDRVQTLVTRLDNAINSQCLKDMDRYLHNRDHGDMEDNDGEG